MFKTIVRNLCQVPQTILSVVLFAVIMLMFIGCGLVIALLPAATVAALGYHLITLLPEQASHAIFTALPWTVVAGVIVTRLVAGRDKFVDIAMMAAEGYLVVALAFYALASVGVTVYYVGLFASEAIRAVPQMTLDDVLSVAGTIALILIALVIPRTDTSLGEA